MTNKAIKVYKEFPVRVKVSGVRGKFDYDEIKEFSESGDFDVPMDDYTGIITATYNSVENGADFYVMSVDILPDHSVPDPVNQCLMDYNQTYTRIGRTTPSDYELVGDLTENKHILSGFSSSNYAIGTKTIPSGQKQFKFIAKAFTGPVTSTIALLSTNDTAKSVNYFGLDSSLRFSLCRSGSTWTNGVNVLTASTTYWFKVELVDGNYIGYTAEDDGYSIGNVEEKATWRQEWSYALTDVFASYTVALGLYINSSSSSYWRGTIDMANTSLVINDEDYLGVSSRAMPGIFYNYTDTGAEVTLNCFYDGSKYLLTKDYSIGSYPYLGTVTVPEHTAKDYDSNTGTWRNKA